MYYYSIDGATYGPYNLEQLLDKIDADTLVYREGIDWTNAKNVEELKKFFIKSNDIIENIASSTPSYNIENQTVETKKMFAAPFSHAGRIRRQEYAISLFIYYVLYLILYSAKNNNSFLFLIFFIPILWFIIAQGTKRCHDRGNSGWYQIIPFYIFWMLFAEGDKGVNEYGDNPKY